MWVIKIRSKGGKEIALLTTKYRLQHFFEMLMITRLEFTHIYFSTLAQKTSFLKREV